MSLGDTVGKVRLIRKNQYRKDCGIVAVYNATTWCNIRKQYGEIKKLAESCGYNPDRGLYKFQISNMMRKLNLPVKRIRPKSIQEVERRLLTGKFFMFLYTPTGDQEGHAVTAFMTHEGRIKLINPQKERNTWTEFASDILTNGMKEFNVYEFPARS